MPVPGVLFGWHDPVGGRTRCAACPSLHRVGRHFDNRSFALNDELNIAFRDPGVVAELETHFLADLEATRELDLAAWRARPLAMRAREPASALVRREL
jgi:hypothetical protein